MSEMNIPQVNALATDRNREQTKRICELEELLYRQHEDGIHKWTTVSRKVDGGWEIIAELPNGSLSLDMVVGMLEAEGIGWFAGGSEYSGEWAKRQVKVPEDNEAIVKTDDPHDLTAAMDALIKVLEEKNNADTNTAAP